MAKNKTIGFCQTNTGTITDCYFDQTIGKANTASAGGIPKTTAEMMSIGTYEDWDICDISEFNPANPTTWFIDEGYDYPRLWLEYERFVKGIVVKINNKTYKVNTVKLPLAEGEGYATFVETSDATATAEDIAEGKTAYVNGEKITGTMILAEPDN